MSRLSRVTQTIFASLAGLNQISQFGSLAQGSPAFTTSPATAQTATWAAGWFSAVLGNNSPAMEDVNALFFVITYQLAYMLQLGVQEWDASTTYYIGSLAQDGSGNVYVSLTNNNTNNALSSNANWRLITGPVMTALGDMIYGGTGANATRIAGNTTTTMKFLTQTGTGSVSAAPVWTALTAPTLTRLTTGSGTYTPPAGVLYLKIKACAGGGGGGGNGNTATAGSDGGDTTLGSIITCHGGKGAGAGGVGGLGGTASFTGPVGRAQSGTVGANGQPGVSTGLGGLGGSGGSNPFAGAAPLSLTGNSGIAGLANTGAGGQGGATGGGGSQQGAGGGGGGYVDVLVTTIAASYAYSIGAGGAGGPIGTSGTAAGGDGGSGVIEIEEHYQ